jgi:hypothetical protein
MAWLRPVNITANVGVALPTQSTTLSTSGTAVTETVNPTNLLWSFALEYTQLTTNSYYGSDGKVRRFPRGWVPLVEFALTTPLNGPNAGLTTGTVNPGVIWVGRYLQFGVEAIVPVNARWVATSACARRPTYIFRRYFPTRSASRSSASERTRRDA